MSKPVRIGILCPSEIAYRRFLPALSKQKERFTYVGVAAASEQEWSGSVQPSPASLQKRKEKLEAFTAAYGGNVFSGYGAMLDSDDIDAVYIPLPPALHAVWGREALRHGKHVLLEKPFTTSFAETEELLHLAEEKHLAVYENYMFVYHSQLEKVRELLAQGAIGAPRLYRMCFGFPRRASTDFRYSRELGGGALLDCGGYPLRLSQELLGKSTRVVHARLIRTSEFEVDISGSVTVENNDGAVAQIAFGMDNEYRCELDIWGSAGSLYTPRIFTAGADVSPTIILRQGGKESIVSVPCIDQFEKSILKFYDAVTTPGTRAELREAIVHQAKMIAEIQEMEIKS